MKNIPLIGSDPELFIAIDGKIGSAIGRIGGTKEAPRPVTHGALQEDNVLLEFNTTPAGNLEEFRRNIQSVMQSASNDLAAFQASIVAGLSSHSYDIDDLIDFGPEAFVFGCDPDYNAWTGEMNPRPHSEDMGLRTAGGHVHIGYSHLETVSEEKNSNIIQMCDYLLGLPSVLLDNDTRRRQLYGGAGAMRHKSYGPEYRTLSNFWVFSDSLIGWAYESSLKAYTNLAKLDEYKSLVSGEEVQRIINQSDRAAAQAALAILDINYA